MFFRIPQELKQSINKVYIIDKKFADVNGDGLAETLIITGKKPYGENGFVQDITLTITNEKTGLNIKVEPKERDGYYPKLFIGRFDEEIKVPDVLLSIALVGNEEIYFNYIYSFKNNLARLIFDYDKFNEESVYDAIYEDYYKVRVKSQDNNLKGTIDLATIRDREYLDKIYNSNGILKEPTVAGVLSLSGLSPLSLNGSDVFELLATQRIIGIYNSDTLGYVESILQWEKDKFISIETRLVVLM